MPYQTEIRKVPRRPEVGNRPFLPDLEHSDDEPEIDRGEDSVAVIVPLDHEPEITDGFVPDLDDEEHHEETGDVNLPIPSVH